MWNSYVNEENRRNQLLKRIAANGKNWKRLSGGGYKPKDAGLEVQKAAIIQKNFEYLIYEIFLMLFKYNKSISEISI